MLEKLNIFLQRYIAILTPLSLIIGVLFENILHHLLFLVAWIFAFMTFAGSLRMKFKDLTIFIKHPIVILISIAFLHIVMPLWAYLLSTIIFDDHLLIVGFVLSVAVPTGVTSMIWITICKGNIPLGLSIILIDTLLAPIIMPFLLLLVSGERIELQLSSLMISLTFMIVLPTLLGIAVNELSKGQIPQKISSKLAPFSKLALFAVIMINSSTIAPYLKNINMELVTVISLILVIAICGYVFTMLIGRYLLSDDSHITAFIFTGGMRNIALGVVIATTYFPAKVAMPVVFGMLFQQVLASVVSKVMTKAST
ncbi:bile acid:sodium symporter family protein [Metasolibacillus sp.]|uniref:bile acid:sodium symporter family protein n=1 Tax=Metasolibacillus sp. TaxID=2703680 RepID=UPI0025CEEFA3|nr:bile acid:sodium symporter family protein [Metasolibacillus sp.]MCT6923729.1 bile acid:sodium symporter family protein [Metasolibacillus sp.]MCT6940038.1 bile acid:sodium symporter family protein [Metasolibacillus sp.]